MFELKFFLGTDYRYFFSNEFKTHGQFFFKKKEQKLAQEQRSLNQLGTNGTKQVNGKSPERSDSPTSTSTATSVGTVTPPSHGMFLKNIFYILRNDFLQIKNINVFIFFDKLGTKVDGLHFAR